MYNSNVITEKCAVVSRIAPSFLRFDLLDPIDFNACDRFGSYQIALSYQPETARGGPSIGNYKLIQDLVDFTIESYFPEIHQQPNITKKCAVVNAIRLTRPGRCTSVGSRT